MIIKGEHLAAEEWTNSALADGNSAKEIIDNGLIPGMDVVGQRFKNNEYFMPDVLVSARAMKICMATLRPLISDTGESEKGSVIIGTVQGDLHDIGKNLVGMMLEGAGFVVHDLGVDVTPEAFVKGIEEHSPSVLAMSALLTTTMPIMQSTVDAVKEAELRNQVKIIVGGAPVSDAFAERIGADGFAPDAARAVEMTTGLLD